jgi:hypothetical protein
MSTDDKGASVSISQEKWDKANKTMVGATANEIATGDAWIEWKLLES